MVKTKVVKAGAKVGVYTAVGMAVETFVTVLYPNIQGIPGLGNGAITVGVSVGIGALVNWFKHRKD
jgi:hypothetical protein